MIIPRMFLRVASTRRLDGERADRVVGGVRKCSPMADVSMAVTGKNNIQNNPGLVLYAQGIESWNN